MPSGSTRYPGLRRLAIGALIVLLIQVVGLVVCGALLMAGGDVVEGLALVCGTLLLGAVGVLLFSHALVTHRLAGTTHRVYGAALESLDELRRQTGHAKTVAENSTLSDWAKRVVYREKDHEFVRDMIAAAIVRQDWALAEHLIEDMDTQLGYAEEAARQRAELTRVRQSPQADQVEAALRRIDELCTALKWRQARQETARLQTLFADDERIRGLPRTLELRRQQRKRQLLQDYDKAVHVQDMERAHNILIELDEYLTPNEVAALKDSARGVFKARLLQMGVRFSLAVNDRKYPEAIAVGETLMREFPNSRYAHEIADMMPALRQRSLQESRHDGQPTAS